MTADEQRDALALTDAEWRAFQSIPEQGYSHRGWIDARIRERLDAARREAAEAEAAVDAAPHAEPCLRRLSESRDVPCICWKSAAPHAALDAVKREAAAEALEEARRHFDKRGLGIIAANIGDYATKRANGGAS
jgi:hypothetical protein